MNASIWRRRRAMRRTQLRPIRRLVPLVALAGALFALMLTVSGSASPVGGRQRIVIDEALQGSRQTFVLTTVTAGPLTDDSGTASFVGGLRASGSRDGQDFKRYGGVETFQGKHGTLRVPNTVVSTEAPRGYGVGVGTWTISGGAGSYAGLRGGGRQSVVGTRSGATFTRYEGYVRSG
jgi:hypothetical protein